MLYLHHILLCRQIMGNGVLDIFAAAVALTLAIVLTCVKMPSGELWQAMRRMNRLLITCYVAMGISNIVTGLLGVSSSADPVMCVSMLVVSMYQALLFTATCVTFVSPHTISAGWLTKNGIAITLVGIATVYALCLGGSVMEFGLWAGIVAYIAEILYYCHLFKTCYSESLYKLESSYDEDMKDSLRLVKNCFVGALTVGLSALLYVVFRLGNVWYNAFTCIYTLYYIYLVICIINYRICAGYIVKVVAAKENEAEVEYEVETSDTIIDTDEELRLADAINKWVDEKLFVRNDQTVEEIAAELGTTHAMLKWYFTNRMHTTFRTWRLDLRVEEAKRLLRDEDASTSSVHTLVGVADKSNFHKLFRKQVGMTPKEYKEQISAQA